MKMKSILLVFLTILGIFSFTSCMDSENNSHVNSSVRLLPAKIITEHEASSRRIFTYNYDENNRLISYVETSLFGNNIGLEDMETACRITYNSSNEIDSLIIIPRLLNDFADVNNTMSAFVNDTIVFDYEGQEISINYKNKDKETIMVDPQGNVLSYKYNGGAEGELEITNHYHYDDAGNITKVSIHNGIESPYIPYTYNYDKRNGIFKNINVPQWFLVIMLNQNFNLLNNYNEYIDYDGGSWSIEYDYNSDDYPIFRRIAYDGTDKIKVSEAPTRIDYIPAK